MNTLGAGQSPTTWLENNTELWPLLIPLAPVERILAMGSKEAWSSVAEELRIIIESSTLGRRLFAWAGRLVTDTLITKKIGEHVKKILASAKIARNVSFHSWNTKSTRIPFEGQQEREKREK